MAASKDLPCCDAGIHVHKITTIQRIAFYDDKQCSRKGRVAMHNEKRPGKTFHFCRTHARMAHDGYVDEDGRTMDPNSRSDYQRGNVRERTRHHGIWKEGEAPAAPTLDQEQLRLLGRSVKAAEKHHHSLWIGCHVPVTGKTINVASGLHDLGLGYFREEERERKPGMAYSFCANEPGVWLFKQTSNKGTSAA